MGHKDRTFDAMIVSFFEQTMDWWTDVYRDDLPRGFLSFDMRKRLNLVTEKLSAEISERDDPAVLECGCGPGDILERLAPLPCRLTGLDLNRHFLELAAEKVPEANLVMGNIEELDYARENFDIVYAVGVLSYVKNDEAAIREMARVTKKGGTVLISVPNYYMLHLLLDPYYVYRAVVKRFRAAQNDHVVDFDYRNIRRYSLKQLKKLCSKYGLRTTSTSCSGFGPLRFWCQPLLPLRSSMRVSETLRALSTRRSFSCLCYVGNQLIVTLQKE